MRLDRGLRGAQSAAKEIVELLSKSAGVFIGRQEMDEKTLGMDGALLVRFLAGESREVGP